MKTRKVPMRMCVSCREMKPKRELTRVVRGDDGIAIDPTSKASGRGAYLCNDPACLQKAIKSRALERALEGKISPEVYEQLQAQWPPPAPENEGT
jgi:Predicted nucleic-acid-binding protein implicated in transcription termination